MALISLIILFLTILPTGYLVVLAVASMRSAALPGLRRPSTRFIIAIPAHDEESVIAATVKRLGRLDYPAGLFSIHIVADHCTDDTAVAARRAGAFVHERSDGPRTGKGAALSWLFQRILDDNGCDAIVVFDSDTLVDRRFLRVMDARLSQGTQVIQGQHIISNPSGGWFPALTWAMFMVDNRFQNLGRANLGLSAKNMGDSICYRAEVLRTIGFGQGLTEDYQLRQRLLLEGIRIVYEPAAKGYGEAPLTWAQAQAQRARWLRGAHDASVQSRKRLLMEGIKRRDAALLEGSVQTYLPSYSTLTVISSALLLAHLLANWQMAMVFPFALIGLWAAVVATLFAYPYFGLLLERAPVKAYLAMTLGPFFILWRTWLALNVRYSRKPVVWVRTSHGG